MRLLLIRHGQTPANVDGILASSFPGPGLTELGKRQADEVPHALRNDQIDGIFASSLVRTQHTAAPLAVDRGMEVQVIRGLQEIEAGDLEGFSDHDSVRTYLKTAFAWGMGDLDPRMPGAADGHEFFSRFDAGIAEIVEQVSGGHAPADAARVAVVFNHGAAIRVWVAGRATNVPPSFAGKHELLNTGVVELDGSPESGWKLISWQGAPVGGAEFDDATAEDVTGETLDEAEADAADPA